MLAFLTLLPLKNYINSSTKQRVWPFRRYNWLIWHVRTTSLQHRMGRKSVFIFVVRWLIWIQSKFTLFCWENINSFITFLKCILINTGSISTSTVVHVSHACIQTFTCSCENKRKVNKKKKKSTVEFIGTLLILAGTDILTIVYTSLILGPSIIHSNKQTKVGFKFIKIFYFYLYNIF